MAVEIRKGTRILTILQNQLFIMPDLLKLHETWTTILIYFGLLVTSVICKFCDNQFMESSKPLVNDNYDTFLPLFLSLTQLLSCLVTFKATNSQGEVTHKELLSILMCTHFGGTLLMNILERNNDVKSTITAGYSEGLFAILLVFYCRGHFENYKKTFCVIVVFFGAVGTTVCFSSAFTVDKLSLLKVTSLCFIILRNICCKHLHDDYIIVNNRSILTLICATITFTLASFVLVIYLSLEWIPLIGWLFCACVCHVTNTYLVSVYLLKIFSVTTVAVTCMWMQLLQNLFLVTSSTKPGVIVELVAMTTAIVGFLVYVRQVFENQLPVIKLVRTNEMYTRMEFLVFVLGVFTLVVCVFQPKLSQRDLDSLSYIGLL